MSFLAEFKKFALRGSLIDMAVGFTVGAAFSTIAKSLVDNVIMPPVGLALGKADFSQLYVLLRAGTKVPPPYATLEKAHAAGAVTLNYGLFINSLLAFVLVAFAMFLIIKTINRLNDSLNHSFLGTPKGQQDPEDKKCPYCLQVVPYKAVRCAFCTSDLADQQKALTKSLVGQELVAHAQATLNAEKQTILSSKDEPRENSTVPELPLAPEVILEKAAGRR